MCFTPKQILAILITETSSALKTGVVNISLTDFTNLTNSFWEKILDFSPKVVTLMPIRIKYTIE